MESQLDTIRDVSRRLEKLGIPYMLTGSVAMTHYAEPRMTRDIDLVLELAPEGIDTFVKKFSGDYYVGAGAVGEAVRHSSMFNLVHLANAVKVDCIIRKTSEYRRIEFERRQDAEMGGVRTYIVSREDLILSKLVWARDSHSEMQLRDVANLMRGGYDRDYVDKWKAILGVDDLLRELGHG
ncbi:MAG: nucleotidyl transferase AbiEii/AbiGii toxin family protein [Planctomycetota bacterium]